MNSRKTVACDAGLGTESQLKESALRHLKSKGEFKAAPENRRLRRRVWDRVPMKRSALRHLKSKGEFK